MNCGVGFRHGSDPALLWLWCRPVATALIRPLAWEPPCATGAALKRPKKKKKRSKPWEVFNQTGERGQWTRDKLAQCSGRAWLSPDPSWRGHWGHRKSLQIDSHPWGFLSGFVCLGKRVQLRQQAGETQVQVSASLLTLCNQGDRSLLLFGREFPHL